jgi:CubicO group peptidase (beta-lactamase class C family)
MGVSVGNDFYAFMCIRNDILHEKKKMVLTYSDKIMIFPIYKKLIISTGLLCLLLLIFLNRQLSAQHLEQPGFIENELDNYIENALQKWNIPGVAVAIVKDGKTVVAKGYGNRHHQRVDRVDENTLFMIASNTKAFVGTAIAMLENEGRLSLDDKVADYLPGFRMHDNHLTQNVTVMDVLTHRLGLQTFQGDFLYFYSNLTQKDVYSKFPLTEPTYQFRYRYGYCNVGYFWAGEVIEAVTNDSWDKYLYEHILLPLDMKRTKILSVGIASEDNLAAAHTLQNGELTSFPHTNIDVIGPAAGMSSSAVDLSKWLLAQLDSGNYDGKNVIPFEAINKARQPRMLQGKTGHLFNRSNYSLYALGWSLRDYEGIEVVSHSGGILGFVTGVSMVPDINLGVVALTNSDENWFYEALIWEIIDAYLGLPFRDYSSKYHEIYQRRQDENNRKITTYKDTIAMQNPPTLPLPAYAGIYSNPLYGEVEIVLENNELHLIFQHHPNLLAKLQHIADDRFLCSYYPSRMGTEVFPFTIEHHRVRGFSLKVADRLEYTRYFFGKTIQ